MDEKIGMVKKAGSIFYRGAKNHLLNEDTILISTIAGLYQGLKYKGSLKLGIKGGLSTMLAISVMGGVLKVIENKDQINNPYIR